jgi:kynurenine formamidase
VRPEDLERAASELDPGDVLLVRTGRWSAPRRLPGDPGASGEPLGDWAGLHIDCMSMIAERDVAMLGTDSTTDTFPSPTPDSPSIHMLAEVYLGMPLLHSMDLDAVAAACAEQGRRECFFCVAPLKITGGTGSPVAPVCIL